MFIKKIEKGKIRVREHISPIYLLKSLLSNILHEEDAVMFLSEEATMAIKSYQDRAGHLLKEYVLGESLIPYTSILGGVLACKMVYDLAQFSSSVHFKSYCSLSKFQNIEWGNRAISTVHAIFITAMSLYLVFWSDLFSDDHVIGLVTLQSSPLSTFALGISLGYFLSDIGMICWFYPSLGGVEYVIHHLVSAAAIAYAIMTGEGQLYTYMVLISETTTPGINLRWYLDTAGLKRSRAYVMNGVVIFISWLVARILLFIYLFYHVYLHYDEVRQLHAFGQFLIFVVPAVLTIMNLMWFRKICRGLKKTLTKRQ